MAFVQMMNSILNVINPTSSVTALPTITTATAIGVNGADVYTDAGVGNTLVSFFTMLNRDLEQSYIHENVKKILETNDINVIRDLFVLAFQTRDIRGGKGERDLFYKMFTAFLQYKPQIAYALVELIPTYGAWFDIWEIVQEYELQEIKGSKHPLVECMKMVKSKYTADLIAYNDKNYSSISLLAKWLPRENNKTYAKFARRIAPLLYPEITDPYKRMKTYRKDIANLNRAIKTVEINMCGGTWKDIVPAHVPGRNMKAHSNAFLDIDKHLKKVLHPNNEDRTQCRANFLQYFDDLANKKTTAKGAHVLYPHEVIRQLLEERWSKNNELIALYEAQWESIKKSVVGTNETTNTGFYKMIPMCDFSGSMDGTPKEVSAALGLLISEINHPAFRNNILTFDSTPSWYSFAEKHTLLDKLKIMYNGIIGQGLNTDFYKAFRCILNTMVNKRLPVGEEPEYIVVLTDMGWDYACAGNNGKWETILERIQREYKEESQKLWGTESPGWKVPTILVWNLRAEFKEFQATAHTQGVYMISGWSPSVLKILQRGNLESITPYDGLRTLLDNKRYDPVREIVDRYASFFTSSKST